MTSVFYAQEIIMLRVNTDDIINTSPFHIKSMTLYVNTRRCDLLWPWHCFSELFFMFLIIYIYFISAKKMELRQFERQIKTGRRQ